MFPRCFALLCLMVTSTYGKRVQQRNAELAASHGVDDPLPGQNCHIKQCCEELSSNYKYISQVFKAKAPYVYTFYMDARETAPACGLFGAVPDIDYATGPCGAHFGGFDAVASVKDVLQKKYQPSHSQGVVNAILEQGTCEELGSQGKKCWDTTRTKSVMGYQSVWWNDANKSSCTSQKGSRWGTVSWSMGCATDSDGGVRFRAKWHPDDKDDMCGSTSRTLFDLEKVVESWTYDDESSYSPGWVCMDIPTPVGEFEHRLLAYSFGPPPCAPPTSSTAESTTESIEEAATVATTTGSSAKSSSTQAASLVAPPLMSGLIALSMLSLAA